VELCNTTTEPLLVKNLVEKYPITIEGDQGLSDALELMAQNGLTKVPIVDKGFYLGILDILPLIGLIKHGITQEKVKLLAKKNVQILNIEESIPVAEKLGEEFYPVVDKNGYFSGVVFRHKFCDERYKKIKKETQRLRLIIESTHNGIYAVDNKGIITLFNSAAERMLDLKAEDVMGTYVKDSIPVTGINSVLKTGRSEYGQKVVVNGKIFVSNRSPLFYQGSLVGAVAVFQDITELEQVSYELKTVKSLNMELDTIINSSYDGLIITDKSGKRIKVNSAFTRLTGLKEEKFVGTINNELYESGIFHYQSITVRALKEERRVSGIQKVNTGKEVLVTANPVFDNDGKVTRVVTNVRDISELNQLKGELEKTKALNAKYHSELSKLKNQLDEENKIVTNNIKVKQIYELATRVAKSDATVLIMGESGVGKEGLARLIHTKSYRAQQGEFIWINCGAIPENLLESEFFGYEAGAFTGASKSGKKGLFEMANKGTLFLDEIGEMPLSLQVKLLRVLQEQELYRLGGTTPIKLDVRIVAASNKNLQSKVEEKTFREDLFYRLNVVPLRLPPLKERPEDILPLVMYYIKIFNEKYKTKKIMSPKTLVKLQRYHWPGNIRELINVIERLIVTSIDNVLDIDHVNYQVVMLPSKLYPVSVAEMVPLKEAKEILEKQLVNMALEKYGTVRRAAVALGVSHSLIVNKISRYQLRNDDN
jgi:PAS domain S-box-containing protein